MREASKRAVWTTALFVVGLTTSPAWAAGASTFGAVSCAEPVGAKATPVRLATSGQGTGRRGAVAARPAAQVSRNERADVTLELRAADGGGAEVVGTSGDLQIKKTVQNGGDFVLEISTPRDRVSVAVSGQETSASRGRTRVRMPRSTAGGAEEGRTRRLLADSEAVLRMRGVAAALIDSDDRSPAALSVVMADAIVGMLAGDVGAPRRVAKYLARNGGSGVRPAAMAVDCFTVMETRMNEAWNDYTACWSSVYPTLQTWCGYRWILQAESYWFSFLSCSGMSVY